jgi:serine/threonine-protein kinase
MDDTTQPFSSARTILPHVEGDPSGARLVAERRTRYEPVRSLGEGGMGEVMLVLDRDIGRLVAVKRLLPDFDVPTAQRFVEEIRTLGRIEHPNIVPIYDVGVGDDGRYFFVMKYVDGEPLDAVLDRLRAGDAATQARYPCERRVRIALDVLRALGAAHAHGVLHRDIKPSNVLIGKDGRAVLVDWGIATPLHPKHACDAAVASGVLPARALVGTPAYMSPEQAGGRHTELDARSDLYSATVLLHELLTLEHYLGPRVSAEAMLIAVIAEGVSPDSLRSLPPEIARFVAKGLAKDPDDRFGSADEMILELERLATAHAVIDRAFVSVKRRLRGVGRVVMAQIHFALILVVALAWRVQSTLRERITAGTSRVAAPHAVFPDESPTRALDL